MCVGCTYALPYNGAFPHGTVAAVVGQREGDGVRRASRDPLGVDIDCGAGMLGRVVYGDPAAVDRGRIGRYAGEVVGYAE